MLLLSTLLSLAIAAAPADSAKTYNIREVVVSKPIKHNGRFEDEPVAVSALNMKFIEANRIGETKDLSLIVPNFFQPDYGSKMTSSIYVRGIGARMDQPSVGLYVDNIPVLNKNNYDIDYYDVANIYLLRGPQGTLYGRNTIGGVIDIHTLSPLSYQGTRIMAGYGNGNKSEAKAATYQKLSDDFGLSIALSHRYSDGFFTNRYSDTSADRILSEGGRIKAEYRFSQRWSMTNVLSANYVKQKGFAYAPYDTLTGRISSIDHNDDCSYERLNIMDGLTFSYYGNSFVLSSTTSYQYTDDDMDLDQDFSPLSMFTLRQKQKEHALTQEFVLRTVSNSPWQSTSGVFGFYKGLDMSAPVELKRDGIQNLILDKANSEMPSHMELRIENDAIVIGSDFDLPVFGVSAYHQSSYTVGKWRFTAGIRADYERATIEYTNNASVNYLVSPMMPFYKELPVELEGKKRKTFFELMPQASAAFNLENGQIYASLSRGYKSGGFNTQMFSDIVQGRMMSDLGFPSDGSVSMNTSSIIAYKPEYSWNYEVGAHFGLADQRLHLDAAVFYIDLRDQQLTVFPQGQTTGRMMSNAGQSRSMGAEVSLAYHEGAFDITGSYGYTNAKFEDYFMEGQDYSKNYVPYVPQHTLSLIAGYKLPLGGKCLKNIFLNAGWQGAGKIYWNESNTATQKFYHLVNASATLDAGRISYGIWGRNLTGTRYNTFYFTSMKNSFVQRGKPIQFGFTVDVKL